MIVLLKKRLTIYKHYFPVYKKKIKNELNYSNLKHTLKSIPFANDFHVQIINNSIDMFRKKLRHPAPM